MIADRPVAATNPVAELQAEIAALEAQFTELQRRQDEATEELATARDNGDGLEERVRNATRAVTAAKALKLADGDAKTLAKAEKELATAQKKLADVHLNMASALAISGAVCEQCDIERAGITAQLAEKRAVLAELQDLQRGRHEQQGHTLCADIVAEHTALVSELESIQQRLAEHYASIPTRLREWPQLARQLLTSSSYTGNDLYTSALLYFDCLERAAGKQRIVMGGVSPSISLDITKGKLDRILSIPGNGARDLYINRQNCVILRDRCRAGDI